MGNKKVPNAWDDDDWEVAADRGAQGEETQESAAQAPKTKAERLAEHRELNRKLWQEAEEPPAMPYHVATSSNVPFTQGFKQPMKLLSRKPVTRTIDPVTGIEKLTVEDDEGDEGDKKPQATAAEIEEQRKRELEKKNRDYEQTRAKLFGTPPPETNSGTSTPGAMTPPLVGEGSRGSHRGRGRGRGGRGGRGGQRNDSYRNERTDTRTDSQERRPGNSGGSPFRELFDPDAALKPAPRQQRGGSTSSPTRGPEPAIRNPRGPDNSGRGGFGFANRGAKEG